MTARTYERRKQAVRELFDDENSAVRQAMDGDTGIAIKMPVRKEWGMLPLSTFLGFCEQSEEYAPDSSMSVHQLVGRVERSMEQMIGEGEGLILWRTRSGKWLRLSVLQSDDPRDPAHLDTGGQARFIRVALPHEDDTETNGWFVRERALEGFRLLVPAKEEQGQTVLPTLRISLSVDGEA